MARDEHGNVIRHGQDTEDDENLTEDESSYSRQPKSRTGHTSKFPRVEGNPSDMKHRQKKVHLMMLIAHIQGSAEFKDDLEKPRKHINNNPDRSRDADDEPPLLECFDSEYLTSVSPGEHVRIMDEWENALPRSTPKTACKIAVY